MQKLFLLPVFFLLCGISPVFSQKYSNEFLAIGVGGRAHGMSGAQTALANDLTSVYWNAAGLTEIDAPLQLAGMHAEWFGGVGQYDFLSFGKSLNREKKAFLAFSLIRLGIDQIPYTINLVEPDGTINYDNISEFSAADIGRVGMGSSADQTKGREAKSREQTHCGVRNEIDDTLFKQHLCQYFLIAFFLCVAKV